MAPHRTINWSQALRDLKAERIARPAIREERLHVSTTLTSWRGRSGRRYVCSVRTPFGWDDDPTAVVIPVLRDAAGVAHIVAVTEAMEIHVHRLATTKAERDAIRADLA